MKVVSANDLSLHNGWHNPDHVQSLKVSGCRLSQNRTVVLWNTTAIISLADVFHVLSLLFSLNHSPDIHQLSAHSLALISDHSLAVSLISCTSTLSHYHQPSHSLSYTVTHSPIIPAQALTLSGTFPHSQTDSFHSFIHSLILWFSIPVTGSLKISVTPHSAVRSPIHCPTVQHSLDTGRSSRRLVR